MNDTITMEKAQAQEMIEFEYINFSGSEHKFKADSLTEKYRKEWTEQRDVDPYPFEEYISEVIATYDVPFPPKEVSNYLVMVVRSKLADYSGGTMEQPAK